MRNFIIADNGLQPVSKMMVTVTKPLEDALKRVPDLKVIQQHHQPRKLRDIGFYGLARRY